MRAHGCPIFSFELQQRLHAEANRKHPNDEPLNGVHAEENCTAAEEASGAPFGLDGLGMSIGNVVGENRRVRCCTALSPAARPSSRRARERAMAWGRRRRKPGAARRAMKRATIDETAELGKARGCGVLHSGFGLGQPHNKQNTCEEVASRNCSRRLVPLEGWSVHTPHGHRAHGALPTRRPSTPFAPKFGSGRPIRVRFVLSFNGLMVVLSFNGEL
jgi:hypothetical protein